MAGEPSEQADDDVTETQREATIAALRTAAGEGQIDLEEFGERAGAVFGARRVEELRAVLADLGSADLPVLSPTLAPDGLPVPPPPRPRGESQYVVAVMSGADRRGTWTAKAEVNAVAIMGGCTLDFRHAELSGPVTQVNAVTIMGGIDVVVPEGVPVEVDGFVLMGGIDDKTRSTAAPGAPMLRVRAYGMMGGVTVRHPRRRERERPDEVAGPPPAGPAPAVTEPAVVHPTLTLLCTQLVGSTALAESLGDQRWFRVLQAQRSVLRAQFEGHGGEVVKTQGDGFLVSFPSVREALSCAIAVQRALVSHRTADPGSDIHVRIGVHSGEVIAADGDLFGRNVDLTSMIVAEAEADEILVSMVTKQLADAGGDLDFGPGRPTTLPGLTGEWVLHALRWS